MDNNLLKTKTLMVIIVTLITMVAEIYFGIITKSMALTADGFHMGTHVIALGITFVVCLFAVKYQDKSAKFNALGGFTSAILLGFTSIGIIYESIERFFKPLQISFGDAILVAIIGLIVNAVCVLIMGDSHGRNYCGEEHEHHHHTEENLNYKAAYLHILADALTSVLAIGALLAGKYFGLVFLDPVIGIVGGLVIAKWAIGLIKSSALILLDSSEPS